MLRQDDMQEGNNARQRIISNCSMCMYKSDSLIRFQCKHMFTIFVLIPINQARRVKVFALLCFSAAKFAYVLPFLMRKPSEGCGQKRLSSYPVKLVVRVSMSVAS